MKRICILATAVALFSSCLGNGSYEQSFTDAYAAFNNYSLRDCPDSVYFKTSFADPASTVALVFNNEYSEDDKSFQGGFAISMKRDSSLVIAEGNKYPNLTVYTNPPVKETTNINGFIVLYDNGEKPKEQCGFLYKDYGSSSCTMVRCFVTNTQPVVKYFTEKGFPNKALPDDQDERLVLKVTGYLKGAKTGESKEFVLGCKDSLNVKWTPLSLAPLGSIDELRFSLTADGTDECLKYCCIDNICANIHIKL